MSRLRQQARARTRLPYQSTVCRLTWGIERNEALWFRTVPQPIKCKGEFPKEKARSQRRHPCYKLGRQQKIIADHGGRRSGGSQVCALQLLCRRRPNVKTHCQIRNRSPYWHPYIDARHCNLRLNNVVSNSGEVMEAFQTKDRSPPWQPACAVLSWSLLELRGKYVHLQGQPPLETVYVEWSIDSCKFYVWPLRPCSASNFGGKMLLQRLVLAGKKSNDNTLLYKTLPCPIAALEILTIMLTEGFSTPLLPPSRFWQDSPVRNSLVLRL